MIKIYPKVPWEWHILRIFLYTVPTELNDNGCFFYRYFLPNGIFWNSIEIAEVTGMPVFSFKTGLIKFSTKVLNFRSYFTFK
jgi:hypothetical protein